MPLKREFALQTKASFDAAFKNPDLKYRSGPLLVLAKKNSLGFPRLGLSVKKSDFSLAVDRNKIKRMLKVSFAKLLSDLPGLDFVVLVNRGNLESIKKESLKVFKKAALTSV